MTTHSLLKRVRATIAVALLSLPTAALASTFGDIMSGFKKTGTAVGVPIDSSGAPQQQFSAAWLTYINGLVAIMSLLFMVLVLYGGWLWLTARGKEEQVMRGRDLIIQATIGLGIIIGSRIFVELAINQFLAPTISVSPSQ